MSDAALVARLLEHARLHEMLHCSSPHHAQQAKWAADLREAARLLVQDADMVAAERERWRAAVTLGHLYAGACPDDEQPDSRDEHCPLCVMLGPNDGLGVVGGVQWLAR